MACSAEFGLANIGERSLIRIDFCGVKVSRRHFRNHFSSFMSHLNFVPCLDDPGAQLRLGVKSYGTEHYEHVLSHTDDSLVVSEDAEIILRNEIGKCFELKEGSIGSVRKASFEILAEA